MRLIFILANTACLQIILNKLPFSGNILLNTNISVTVINIIESKDTSILHTENIYDITIRIFKADTAQK